MTNDLDEIADSRVLVVLLATVHRLVRTGIAISVNQDSSSEPDRKAP